MIPVSSAEPYKLRDYSTFGLAMIAEVRAKADAVHAALEALRPYNRGDAAEFIPNLQAVDRQLYNLLDRWEYLDTFARQVAEGFIALLHDPDTTVGFGGVLTVQYRDLLGVGVTGWADREEAVAEAERLAEELKQLMEDVENGETIVWGPPKRGGLSMDHMEDLAALASGRGDPAFAVAFVEAMGVNGMVGMRGLFRDYANQARAADEPREDYWTDDGVDRWVDDQMAPAAVTLSLATATRSDPAASQRLDGDWARRFERYAGDEQENYSLLVKQANLPADVLVGVGNHHVFGGDAPSTPDSAHNILDAIAANPDASVGWLSSEPAEFSGRAEFSGGPDLDIGSARTEAIPEGTTNLELALTYGEGVYGDAETYEHLADVVESGLTHPTDTGGRHQLMRDTISVVGADGDTLWEPPETARGGDEAVAHMRNALAAGVQSNMYVVDYMVNDGWPDIHAGQEPPHNAYLTHEFLREVMIDEDAANRVLGGYEEYAIDRISHLPAEGVDNTPGEPVTDRQRGLRELGAVEAVIVEAESNAVLGSIEERIARQQSRAAMVDAGVDGAAYAAGFIPGAAGPGIGALETAADMSGVGVGRFVFPANFGDLEEAVQDAKFDELNAKVNLMMVSALVEDPDGAPYLTIGGLSDEQRQELIEWAMIVHNPDDHGQLELGYSSAENWFEGER